MSIIKLWFTSTLSFSLPCLFFSFSVLTTTMPPTSTHFLFPSASFLFTYFFQCRTTTNPIHPSIRPSCAVFSTIPNFRFSLHSIRFSNHHLVCSHRSCTFPKPRRFLYFIEIKNFVTALPYAFLLYFIFLSLRISPISRHKHFFMRC